jgi:adenylate cyclase
MVFLQGLLKTRKSAYSALAPLVALLLLWPVLATGLLEGLENVTVDWRFHLRARSDPAGDPRVIFVMVDEPSLALLGKWPWSRTIHGRFCQLLADQNPSVVAFDILFTEPSADEKEDDDLSEGATAPQSFVSGAEPIDDSNDKEKRTPVTDFGKTQPLSQVEGDISKIGGADAADFPIPVLRKDTFFAFVNAEPGSDGVRRDLPMVVRVGHDVFPGLSLQILCQYWGVAPDQVRVRLGHDIELPSPEGMKSIPIDGSGKMLLNYHSQASYDYVSRSYGEMLQMLFDHDANKTPLGADFPDLKDKIVLVGESDPSLSDNGPSPVSAHSPLPLVHVTALNNILRGDYLSYASVWPIIFGWLLVSWLTLFYVSEKSISFSVAVPILIVGLYLAVAYECFVARSVLLPVVWPVLFFAVVQLGLNVLRWIEEQQSKKQIKETFSSYIAPAVLNVLLEHPESIRLGGVRKPVTIFFSDIRGFSSLSENMGEEELVFQLNEYFEKMVGCVNHHRGTLHKYIGDAIMAAWGDVLSEKIENDAASGVRSALEMREAMVGLNKTWREQKRPELKIGMGLNHGMAVVGNIGATQRREFTLIGDAVNLASRLEGITKKFKTDLIISESVHDLVRGEFLSRTVGVIQAMGMTRPVKIYEVLEDLKKPQGQWKAEWVVRYEQAIDAFFSRKFTEAQKLFKKCLEEREGDYCCGLYIKLCEEMIKHPPGKDWDGTQVMDSK